MLEKYLSSTDKAKIEVSICKLINKKNKNYSFSDVAQDFFTFLNKVDEKELDIYLGKVDDRAYSTLMSSSEWLDREEIMATDAIKVYEAKQSHSLFGMNKGEISIESKRRDDFSEKERQISSDGFEEDEEELPNIDNQY